ncbi:MAG: hypothetical protein ABWY55_10830 [Microbacterium sp.]
MPRPDGPVASVPFDARPLVEPVSRSDVAAFTRTLRAQGRLPAIGLTVIVTGIAIGIGATFLAVFAGFFASIIGAILSAGDSSGVFVVVASILPTLIVLAVVAVIVFAIVRALRGSGDRRYRLDRFARANGMSYVPALANPGLPGMIFGIGGSRQSSDLVRGEKPRFVEFGNYAYTTGSGKNRTTHQWGYVAVKLDAPLPHIVLDATGNNSLFGSNLPASFDREQRLSLEGDFDQHFSLYCPADYEPDALYLFTPDIMARFIDSAAALDVEIVDDWLFLYGKRQFSTLDPATWAWLFSVVAALLDKLAQWGRWRDERLAGGGRDAAFAPAPHGLAASAQGAASAVPFEAPTGALRPPPGVAPQGRRLTRRSAWIGIVVVAAVMLFFWLSQFLGGWFIYLNSG